MRRTVLASGIALIGAATAVLPAQAQGPSARAELELRLDTPSPDTRSGLTIRLRYRGPGRDDKPSPIRRVQLQAPAGLRFDTAATPTCSASDEQLRALGQAACPAGSQVGLGSLTAISGAGEPVDPLRGDVRVFNGGTELIELVSFRGTGMTAGVDRLRIDGATLTGNPPSTPGGPPDGETAVESIVLSIPASPAGTRPFVVSPPRCPLSGAWTSAGRFGFANGASAVASDISPCRPPSVRLTRRCVGDGRLRLDLLGDAPAVQSVVYKVDRRALRRADRESLRQVIGRGRLSRALAADRRRLRAVVSFADSDERVVLSRSLPSCGLR